MPATKTASFDRRLAGMNAAVDRPAAATAKLIDNC